MQPSLPAEILLLEGPDAAAFAHAQFSSKVDSLDVGQWQFSAWLEANGRVRVLFHLARLAPERYALVLRGGRAAVMAEALQRFVFRSKLTLAAPSGRTLVTGTRRRLHSVEQADDVISLGCGSHSLDVVATHPGDDAWRLLQLREGWAWLPPSTLDTLLPAALSLQRLQAVAVDKGCYPGQEIVARLHFRGGHKRHLHRVVMSEPMESGTILRIDGREVGCALEVLPGGEHFEALMVLSDDIINAEPAAQGQGSVLAFDQQPTATILASWPA